MHPLTRTLTLSRRKATKLFLVVLAVACIVGLAMAAEVRNEKVPMDVVPWDLSEPRLEKGDWWEAPHIPINHPYWWTLTDELSPAELKQRLERRVEARRAEVKAGRRRATAQSVVESPVTWSIQGGQEPELFPVWSTFYSFASAHVTDRPREEVVHELVTFGLDPEAAEVIIKAAEETWASDLSQEITEAMLQLRSLRLRAEEQLGPERAKEMWRTNDFALLSEQVGWSQAALRDLVQRSARDWRAESAVPAIVSLRREIGERQWDLFRRYLLVEVASRRAELYTLGDF